MAPIPRLQPYEGPALFSYGFRPFFLFGSLYAGLAILAWLPMFYGGLQLSTAFAPRDWHIHEMLYGYLSAVITGFLLTAVPNWTGRMPLQGKPLIMLVLIWVAGRVAVTMSAWIGWQVSALTDVSFLIVVAAVMAREIVKGKNWRNLKVMVALGILTIGNIAFHLEAHLLGAAEYGIRIGVAATMMLVMVIGGRIVPSFTRNWLSRENPGRMPASFGTFDMISMAGASLALLVWIALPEWQIAGVALIAAGLVQTVHMARWAGHRTWRDRLVLILHVAYAFVPLGFILTGLASLGLIPAGAGIHAWTGGAMGGMTLAVMSRASLGHTGRALVASRMTQALYLLIVIAAFARIIAALLPDWTDALLHLAGAAWAGTFIGFALTYWIVFTRPRVKA
ncbi:short-chain dehydrogenase [Microvirga sp. KLBC 81]|uniref:NnrS family protein n=1 Tax=Microvirga sp. KLBC 81 TaxID=1862707 RepID=UPI000D51B2B2|nr:NnrS family protein [Microvirga sp. KLBC 81]PVE23019.1 short-chain dehydrogenase [Microvirga sp. KLBC 81]